MKLQKHTVKTEGNWSCKKNTVKTEGNWTYEKHTVKTEGNWTRENILLNQTEIGLTKTYC